METDPSNHIETLATARTNNSSSAVPSSGLYFTLNGVVYLPGETVLITDIGEVDGQLPFRARISRADPGRSLVCATRNVNTQCCRPSDDNPRMSRRIGQWHFPDGSAVFPLGFGFNFARRGFAQEVRLERRNNVMSPTGKYECRVPDEDTLELVNASITLTTG